MSTSVQVTGLRQAAANMQKLSGAAQLDLSGKAMFDCGLPIAQAVRARTYTTFTRRTGFIKSGFSVRVRKQVKNDQVRGYIVQREQSIAGTSDDAKAFRRSHSPKARGRKQSVFSIAFYWLFLERGTHARRHEKTPGFFRKNKSARTVKQQKRLSSYLASGSPGDITPRPWVSIAFAASARTAIAAFEKSFRTRVDTEVANLPK